MKRLKESELNQVKGGVKGSVKKPLSDWMMLRVLCYLLGQFGKHKNECTLIHSYYCSNTHKSITYKPKHLLEGYPFTQKSYKCVCNMNPMQTGLLIEPMACNLHPMCNLTKAKIKGEKSDLHLNLYKDTHSHTRTHTIAHYSMHVSSWFYEHHSSCIQGIERKA